MSRPAGSRRGAAPGVRSARAATPTGLVDLLRFQQAACREIGSVIYDRLMEHSSSRVTVAGPIRDLLAPHAEDPFGSALALRYLGGVHRIVLEGRAPTLAGHYPSVGGSPGPDLEAAFEQVVAEHSAELEARLADGVQTNEVGRSAVLVGALLRVAGAGLPLRVFELGASAGLNLRWDHYRYEQGGAGFGPSDSPVRFVDPFAERAPRLDVGVSVVERRGCDRAPIDATCEAGRLALRSFVWPDLVERFTRLDAAIEVARAVPAVVDAEDATVWTEQMLERPQAGTATVVMHSIVMQYLAPEGRVALLEVIRRAGRRASSRAPLAWVRLEPGPDGAELRMTTWPGGVERMLARSSYHGPPVRWLA